MFIRFLKEYGKSLLGVSVVTGSVMYAVQSHSNLLTNHRKLKNNFSDLDNKNTKLEQKVDDLQKQFVQLKIQSDLTQAVKLIKKHKLHVGLITQENLAVDSTSSTTKPNEPTVQLSKNTVHKTYFNCFQLNKTVATCLEPLKQAEKEWKRKLRIEE